MIPRYKNTPTTTTTTTTNIKYYYTQKLFDDALKNLTPIIKSNTVGAINRSKFEDLKPFINMAYHKKALVEVQLYGPRDNVNKTMRMVQKTSSSSPKT